MSYATIRLAVENQVATITLDRPEVLNALNARMRLEVTHALTHGLGDARVLVLTGAGRAFCSGQDLGDRDKAADIDVERTLREEYEPMLRALLDCPLPTIAAVNGVAAGAGANLALAADVVIAARSASFVQAFARIGLIPDAGGTWLLPRLTGLAKAMGAALFAEKVTADEADAWGMIWEAVPDETFAATVQARAAHLANGPTVAYRLIRQAMRAGLVNGFDAQLELEATLQGEAGRTRDHAEGVLAFIQKRPAAFEGR